MPSYMSISDSSGEHLFTSGSDEWPTFSSTKHHTVEFWHPPVMEIVGGFIGVFILLVILCMICSCCQRKYRGRVLNPPPPAETAPNIAPYPRQQYQVTVHASNATPYAAPVYPTVTPYPAQAAYPGAGAPYPGAGGPYPGAGAPYPGAGAPYPHPTGLQYSPAVASSMPMPQSSAPSAPDHNAMPPPYDHVMAGHVQPPYNPAVKQ